MASLLMLLLAFVGLCATNPISTLPAEPTLKNNTELRIRKTTVVDTPPHNYAMNCGDKEKTFLCQNSQFQYYCDGDGRVAHNPKAPYFNFGCQQWCGCIYIGPKPVICPAFLAYCISLAGNGTTVFVDKAVANHTGDLVDARTTQNETQDRSSKEDTALVTRDTRSAQSDNAMVCEDTEVTDLCAGGPFNYYCSQQDVGKLMQTPGSTKYHLCDQSCQCQDVHPPGQCISNDVNVKINCPLTSGENMGTPFQTLPRPDKTNITDATPTPSTDLALAPRMSPQPDEAIFHLLVCPQVDQFCRNSPYGYFCDKDLHKWYKVQIDICSSRCRCVFVICDTAITYCYANPPKDDLTPQLPANLTAAVKEELSLEKSDSSTTTHEETTDSKANKSTDSSPRNDLPSEVNDDLKGMGSLNATGPTIEKRHSFALDCGDRAGTRKCANAPYRYTCDAGGRLRQNYRWSSCEIRCRCTNIGGPCVPSIWGVFPCTTDESDRNNSTLANKTQIDSILRDEDTVQTHTGPGGLNVSSENPTATVPEPLKPDEGNITNDLMTAARTEQLQDRDGHNYALVCSTRDGTRYCQSKGLFCRSDGALDNKPGYPLDQWCELTCQCQNIAPSKPSAIPIIPICWTDPSYCIPIKSVEEGGPSIVATNETSIDSFNRTSAEKMDGSGIDGFEVEGREKGINDTVTDTNPEI